jgi:hypothetical protein
LITRTIESIDTIDTIDERMSIPILRVRRLENSGNLRTSLLNVETRGTFRNLTLRQGTFTNVTSPDVAVKFYSITNPESAIYFNDTDVQGLVEVSGLTVSDSLSISGNLSVVGSYIGPMDYEALDFINLDISTLRCISGIILDGSGERLVILDTTNSTGTLSISQQTRIFENLHISGNLTMISGQIIYNLPEFNITDISTENLSGNVVILTNILGFQRPIGRTIIQTLEGISNELLTISSQVIHSTDISIGQSLTILPGGFLNITQEENVSGVVGVYRELDVSIHSLDVSQRMEVLGNGTSLIFETWNDNSTVSSLNALSLSGHRLDGLNPTQSIMNSVSGNLIETNHIQQSTDVSLSTQTLQVTSIQDSTGITGVNISTSNITITNEGRFETAYLQTQSQPFNIDGSFQSTTISVSGDSSLNLIFLESCSISDIGTFDYLTVSNLIQTTSLKSTSLSANSISVSGLLVNDLSFGEISTGGCNFNQALISGIVSVSDFIGGNTVNTLLNFATQTFRSLSGGHLLITGGTGITIQNDTTFSHPQGYVEGGSIIIRGNLLHFESLYTVSGIELSNLTLETLLSINDASFGTVTLISGDISNITTDNLYSTTTRYVSLSADLLRLGRLETDTLEVNSARIDSCNTIVVDTFRIINWEISNDDSSSFRYPGDYVDITYNNSIIPFDPFVSSNYFYFNRDETGNPEYTYVDFSANRIVIEGGIFYKTFDNDGAIIDDTGIFTQTTLSGNYTLSNDTVGELITSRYNVPRFVSLDGSGITMVDNALFGTGLGYLPDSTRFTQFLSSQSPGLPSFAVTSIADRLNVSISFGMIPIDSQKYLQTFTNPHPTCLIIDMSTSSILLNPFEYSGYPDLFGQTQYIFPNFILPSPPPPPPYTNGKYKIDISGQIDISLGYNTILGVSNELTISCNQILIGYRAANQVDQNYRQLYNVSAIVTGDIECDLSFRYNVTNNNVIFPFTGSHEIHQFLNDSFSSSMIGRCVCSYGLIPDSDTDTSQEKFRISIHQAPIIVGFTTRANDPRVYGVINDSGGVNALGEGSLWVVNEGGNIQNGDWLTSSSIPGYAMKQSVPYKTSYTIGKALESVDFESSLSGSLYRQFTSKIVDSSGNDLLETSAGHPAVFIGCSYHCG